MFIPAISGTFEEYLHILALYISNCRMLLHTMTIPVVYGTFLKYSHCIFPIAACYCTVLKYLHILAL